MELRYQTLSSHTCQFLSYLWQKRKSKLILQSGSFLNSSRGRNSLLSKFSKCLLAAIILIFKLCNLILFHALNFQHIFLVRFNVKKIINIQRYLICLYSIQLFIQLVLQMFQFYFQTFDTHVSNKFDF